MMIKALLSRFKRFITYGIVGCVNTLVDFSVYSILYGFAGLAPELCQSVGYLTGVLCSFVLNRTVTFKDGTRRLAPQLSLFLIVNGVSWALSTLLIKWLTMAGVNAYVAKLAVTVLIMVVNYFGYKLLVFKVKSGEGEGRNE